MILFVFCYFESFFWEIRIRFIPGITPEGREREKKEEKEKKTEREGERESFKRMITAIMRPTANKDVLRNAAHEMGSKKLIASYIFDWIIIIAFAAAGGALSFVEPHHRPFSLLNQEISFPYVEETITTWMLVIIALVAPAAIITLITLILVPGAEVRRISTRSQVLRLKLWELEKGLAGLALSLAVAFFVSM